MKLFFYRSDQYKTFIMDQWESIPKFSKHSGNFHKCNNFDFYSVWMAPEGFV